MRPSAHVTSGLARISGLPRASGLRPRWPVLAAAALLLAALGVAAAAEAAVPPPPAGWSQVFLDDFNGAAGSRVNTGNWRYTTGTSYPGGPANFGTGEVETMTDSTANVSLDGAGNLRITPQRDGAGRWTSGRIETQRSDFQPPAGGTLRVQARIQQPNVIGAGALGYWPAFWMLGAPYRGNWWNWPGVGEMDIMENVNGRDRNHATLHCGTSPGGECGEKVGIGTNIACPGSSCTGNFHTYTLEWDRSVNPQQLRFYVDGFLFHTVAQTRVSPGVWDAATNHGFFIILNMAMGGEFPAAFGGGPTASTTPGRPMVVDYVAVWQRTGSGPPPPPPPPPPNGTNLALHKPATGSTPCVSTEGPAKAVNGSVSGGKADKWCSGASTKFLRVNLGANASLTSFVVRHAQAGGEPAALNTRDFDIQVSSNGTTFTTVTQVRGNTAAVSSHAVNVSGRYVRLNVRTPTQNGDNHARIYELEAYGTIGAPPPSGDFTQSVTPLNAAQAKISFHPTTPSALVDVHYLVNGANQQNFRMANNGGTWEQTASFLSGGTVLEYWFTYEKGGPLFDSQHFTYTHGGGSPPPPPPGGPGTFPMRLVNNTRGVWSNSQIYVTMLGQTTPGEWSYLKPNGTMAHINHLDENAPGHLTKNGRNYANMSFSLAQATTVTMPPRIEGARVYISIGSPLFFPISPDDRGWGGPDLRNPNDPNADVYYDWYEYTYIFGTTTNFGGNTTMVDQFGFPMTARLQQTAIGYDKTSGITLSRDEIFARYQSTVGPAFRGLANQFRIVAPRSSLAFQPGGAQASYFQAYIDQVWNFYAANTFSLTRLGRTFTGRVTNGVLTGTKSDGTSFSLNKPMTADVVECARTLAPPTNDTSREVGAEFCAAFHRGVAMNTASWYNPATYYQNPIRNEYAQLFHAISIENRAYGFPYDDVNDQSTVRILPNNNPPTMLTLSIGW